MVMLAPEIDPPARKTKAVVMSKKRADQKMSPLTHERDASFEDESLSRDQALELLRIG